MPFCWFRHEAAHILRQKRQTDVRHRLTLQTWHTRLYHSTRNTSSQLGTQIMVTGRPEIYTHLSIFWTHYSTVKPPCSNFRVITANSSGVWIFRIFTVVIVYDKCCPYLSSPRSHWGAFEVCRSFSSFWKTKNQYGSSLRLIKSNFLSVPMLFIFIHGI